MPESSYYERVEGASDRGKREGRWITTKSGHRVYLTGEGKAGNPPTAVVVRTSKRERASGDNPHNPDTPIWVVRGKWKGQDTREWGPYWARSDAEKVIASNLEIEGATILKRRASSIGRKGA